MARPARRTISVLLFAALAAHNLEEGLTYASTRAQVTEIVQRVIPEFAAPPAGAFRLALVGLTIAGGALLSWAACTSRARAGWGAVRLAAAVLLANVFIPHVPAALVLGGYAPGLASALAINLPFGIWVLSLDFRERSA